MRLIESKQDGDVLVLKIFEDELNAAVAERFKEETSLYIDQGHKKIAMNMSKVKFMDSSGLGALIFFLKKAKENGRLSVFGVTKMVLNLLKLTRTYKAFDMYGTEEEAVAALSE